MTTPLANVSSLSAPQKLVLWCCGLAVVAMFVASIVIRLDPVRSARVLPGKAMPSREHGEAEGQAMGGGGTMGKMPMGGPSMEEVRKLMQNMQQNPNDVQAQLELANRFLQMKAASQAQIFVDNALNLQPDNEEALGLKAYILFEGGDAAQAATINEKLVARNPANHMARFNLGILYKHYLQRPEDGRAQLEAILKAKPDDPKMVQMVQEELADPGTKK